MADPRGKLIGYVDEYGTVWDGYPGTGSNVIGDLVVNDDDPEAAELYLDSNALEDHLYEVRGGA